MSAGRRLLYMATRGRHLSAFAQFVSALAVILIALSCGGCSLSRDGAFAGADDSDLTGSITVAPGNKGPTESDLAFARTAASDVLTKGSKDSSQPWENPTTGARGSVTPIADAYTADGRTCRDFLASYVNERSESWMQGAACQSGQGRWDIQSLKPWKRT